MSDQQQHQTTGAGPETKSTTDYTYKPYDKNSKDSSSQKSTSTCDFCDKEGNEQYSCRAGHTYVVCDDCSKSSQKTFKKIFKTGTTPLFFPIFFLLLLPRTSRLALFGCQWSPTASMVHSPHLLLPHFPGNPKTLTTPNGTTLHAPPIDVRMNTRKNNSLEAAQNPWVLHEKWCMCCMQDTRVMKTFQNCRDTWASATVVKQDPGSSGSSSSGATTYTNKEAGGGAPKSGGGGGKDCRYCSKKDVKTVQKSCDGQHAHSVCNECANFAMGRFDKHVKNAGKITSLGGSDSRFDKRGKEKDGRNSSSDTVTMPNGAVLHLPTLQVKGRTDSPMRRAIIAKQSNTECWCMVCLETKMEMRTNDHNNQMLFSTGRDVTVKSR